MKLLHLHTALIRLLETAAAWLRSPFLLLVRLHWGWQFMQTGWGKLNHLDDITAYFGDLGIPLPGFNALLAACTECFGGALLLLGLGSRLVSVPLIVTMGVAYVAADREALASLFSADRDPFTEAAPFLFLFAALIVFVFGPGRFSLDCALHKVFPRLPWFSSGPDANAAASAAS